MSDQPLSGGQKAGLFAGALLTSGRVRLLLAVVLFVGWLAWLGYAALRKSHDPIVSHAQAAAAQLGLVGEVKAGAEGKASQFVTVVEPLTEGSPAAGTEIFVRNLPEATFRGPGPYLLLLAPDPSLVFVRTDGPRLPAFLVVGQQRSPGNDLAGVGPPLIYPWTDDVRKQAERLVPPKS